MKDRQIRLAYKGNACLFCGFTVEETERRFLTSKGAFEFNHIDPSTKSPEYCNLIRRKLSGIQLDELDKCILLCARCHGILHGQGLQGEITFRAHKNGKLVREVRLPCQAILDAESRQITFFCESLHLLRVYFYRLGERPVVDILGADLERELAGFLLGTRDMGSLTVEDESGVVLSAGRLSETEVRIRHHVRWPFFKSELYLDSPSEGTIWVRGGTAVLPKEGVQRKGVVSFSMDYETFEASIGGAFSHGNDRPHSSQR